MRDCIQSTNGLLLLVSDYKICITGAHYRIQAHIKVDFLHHFPTFFHALKKVYSDQKMKIDDVLSNRHENDIT